MPPLAMTRSELLAAAGADEELLAELEDYGLIRRARSYGAQALSVAPVGGAARASTAYSRATCGPSRRPPSGRPPW